MFINANKKRNNIMTKPLFITLEGSEGMQK